MIQKIRLGLSPCPNDTFIFHALLSQLVKPRLDYSFQIEPVMADVEQLNQMALKGELEATKISVGVIPYIMDKYRLMNAGAALGWGCGPLIVARKDLPKGKTENLKIAVPGLYTTAKLLLDLHGVYKGETIPALFSEIMPMLSRGEADVGVIIHEGRFTYQEHDLQKLADLGQWWEEQFGMPLPLGAIAIRRDVPIEQALALQEAISESVQSAWNEPQRSWEFIRENAQELDDKVINAHIETFVTQWSKDLGDVGRNAIRHLLKKAQSESESRDLFLNQ